MSISKKKSSVLVLTASDNSQFDTSTTDRFIELIKACGMTVSVVNECPPEDKAKLFDGLFVDLDMAQSKSEVTEQVTQLTSCSDVVFFNADEQLSCESSALLSGVKGIFYREDRPDITLRGLEAIMNSEPWFKRSTMNKAVTDLLKFKQKNQSKLANSMAEINLPQLTKREQTIVHLVSSGAQNKEIAEQLHISPNTVKTHIYSLFRKTSSRNRIELITWSQQFNSGHILNS